jgi:serine/threonine-protein kinase
MVNATQNMPIRQFPTSDVQFVSIRIDVTQGCLANQYTPPQDIQTQQFIAGTEPHLKVCREPTSYQYLTVPSVIGLHVDPATSLLRSSGFNVRVVYEQTSGQLPGTVVSQNPAAGVQALQTSTVTVTVAQRPNASRGNAIVPNVIGMTREEATATLHRAGFGTTIISQPQCDATDPSCNYQKGRVWSQSPTAGREAKTGSDVRIYVNP